MEEPSSWSTLMLFVAAKMDKGRLELLVQLIPSHATSELQSNLLLSTADPVVVVGGGGAAVLVVLRYNFRRTTILGLLVVDGAAVVVVVVVVPDRIAGRVRFLKKGTVD